MRIEASEAVMFFVEQTIDIRIPIKVIYRQWMDFESYPYFMEGVKAVHQLSDVRLLWLGDIGGEECEWFTEATFQIPNTLIGWRATSGPTQIVTVRFFRLSDDGTRIVYQMSGEACSGGEDGEYLTVEMNRRFKHTLERFRNFIEDRDYASHVWRGEAMRSVAALWQSNEASVGK